MPLSRILRDGSDGAEALKKFQVQGSKFQVPGSRSNAMTIERFEDLEIWQEAVKSFGFIVSSFELYHECKKI